MPNLERNDPTRTTELRRQFMAEMNRRFRSIKGDIRQVVVKEDALGLKRKNQTGIFSSNTRWAFQTDDAKVESFKGWLQQRIDLKVLEVAPGSSSPSEPWTDAYVDSAYKKGVVRAYTDAHSVDLDKSDEFYEGSKSQFLQDAFNAPEAVSKLRLLRNRAYDQLKGVTATMSQQMGTILADGVSRGDSPYVIARNLNNTVTGLTRKRAMTIARTETIHAHAEGQLDSFTRLGVEDVGVMAEWSTAGDDKVCPQCAPLEGVILSVKEARGLIPRHPNCRCSWIPANVGEDTTGQKRNDQYISKALRKSVKAEHPKLPTKAARKESRWAGADVSPKGVTKTVKSVAAKGKPASPLPPKVIKKKKTPKKKVKAADLPKAPKPVKGVVAPTKGIVPERGKYAMRLLKDISNQPVNVVDEAIGGSTGAKLVEITGASGTKRQFVMKQYSGRTDQVLNENLANKFYTEFTFASPEYHVPTPESFVLDYKGKPTLFTRYVHDAEPINVLKGNPAKKAYKKVQEGFVMDAFLANWDSVGLELDNVVRRGGSYYRVDNGGALLFRAQGAPKGKAFGFNVPELTTLRSGTQNPSAVKVFGSLTDKDVVNQISEFKKAITNEKIKELVDGSGFDEKTKGKILASLVLRREEIIDQGTKLEKQLDALSGVLDATQVAKKAADPYYGRPIEEKKIVADQFKDLPGVFQGEGVTPKEKDAVEYYTGPHYGKFNAYALDKVGHKGYENKFDESFVAKKAEKLDELLAKDKLPGWESWSYRGVPDMPDVEEDFEQWKSGNWAHVQWDAYGSSSVRAARAFDSKDGGICFVIKNKGYQGSYVEYYSDKGENELLYGRGARFRVIGVSERKKGQFLPGFASAQDHDKVVMLEEIKGELPIKQQPPEELDWEELWSNLKIASEDNGTF